MKTSKLFFGLIIFGITQSAWAEERVLISTETVPLGITKNAIHCSDAIPDHGFGAVPGGLAIEEEALFDRTLRVQGVVVLYTSFPNGITCADLKQGLDAIPDSLDASRKVYRVNTPSLDRKSMIIRLVGEIQLEIPLNALGQNLVLTGTQDWIEEHLPMSESGIVQIPQVVTYTAITFPQSATDVVGLYCKPSYPDSTEQQLSLGYVAGYDGVSWGTSNVTNATRTFTDLAGCEEVQSELLKRYQAIDPGNWGTPLPVTRKIESIYRYILNNHGDSNCQRIELDTLSAEVEGMKLVGFKSFPIETVALDKCNLSPKQ